MIKHLMTRNFAVLLAVILLVPMLQADVIVLKNGKRFEFDGSYEVKGSYVVFKDGRGELTQLPAKIVDFDKSTQATKELSEKREAATRAAAAKAAAEAKKKAQRATNMAEIVDQVSVKSRERSVVISTKGLKDYNETHDRVINDSVPLAGAGATPTAGTGTGTDQAAKGTQGTAGAKGANAQKDEKAQESTRPTVEQLTDPEYVQSRRKEVKEKYGELNDEMSDLDKQIKEAEYMRDTNAASAAFGAYSGDDAEGNATYEGGPDNSIHYDQMEKAEKHLEDLQQKKEEKSKELSSLEKTAKSEGIRDYNRGQKNQKQADQGSGERYDDGGKRKKINGEDYESKRKSNRDDSSRYDESGKRKKINN